MTTPAWVKMAAAFYGKDEETAERMGKENYFSPAAAKMLEAIASDIDHEAFRNYLLEQAEIAKSVKRG